MLEIWEQLKRYAAMIVGVGLIALNKKLNLNFSEAELVALASTIIGYIGTSTWKATRIAEAEAANQTAKDAVTDLTTAVQTVQTAVVP